MFAEPFALRESAEATWNFNRVSFGGTTSIYAEDSNSAADAVTARIAHTKGGKSKGSGLPIDRHNLSVSRTQPNATSGLPESVVCSLTLSIPQGHSFTDAEIDAVIYSIGDFLRGTNAATYMGKFKRGES